MSRAQKRKRSIAVDRYRVTDSGNDFNAVHAREAAVSSCGYVLQSHRSPQKGRNTWTLSGSPDLPLDNTTFALEESGEIFDQQLGTDVFETVHQIPAPKAKKKSIRSEISVSRFSS